MTFKFNFDFKDAFESNSIRSNSDGKNYNSFIENFRRHLTNACSNVSNDENVGQNETKSCEESKPSTQPLATINTLKAETELKVENQNKRIEELKKSIANKKRKCIELEIEKSNLKQTLSARKAERNAISNGVEKTRESLMKSKSFADYVDSQLEYKTRIIADVINQNKQRLNETQPTYDTIVRKCCANRDKENKKLNELKAEVSTLEEMADKKETAFENCVKESNELNVLKKNQLIEAMKEGNDLQKSYVELDKRLAIQESDINVVDKSCRDLMEDIADKDEKYKLFAENAKQKEEEYSTLENEFQKQIKDLKTKLHIISNEKNSSEMRIKDLESDIENKKLKITDMKADNENLITDKESNIEELKNKKQTLETKVETMRKEFDSRVKEMKRSLENANIKIEELNKTKTKRESSIMELKASISESNANVNQFLDANEKLQTEVNQIDLSRKERDLEIKRLTKLVNSNKAENELLKQEERNLEQKFERNKHSNEFQISKLTETLVSCKMDYNKRIEDKESNLNIAKQKLEKLDIKINDIRNRNETLETEKSKMTVKLQELTYNTQSSAVMLTPKQVLSSLESRRPVDVCTSTVSLPMNTDLYSSLKSSMSNKQSNNDQYMANKKLKSESNPNIQKLVRKQILKAKNSEN